MTDGGMAHVNAATCARAMAADSVSRGHLILDHRIDITCADGRNAGTGYFRDVVKVEG